MGRSVEEGILFSQPLMLPGLPVSSAAPSTLRHINVLGKQTSAICLRVSCHRRSDTDRSLTIVVEEETEPYGLLYNCSAFDLWVREVSDTSVVGMLI